MRSGYYGRFGEFILSIFTDHSMEELLYIYEPEGLPPSARFLRYYPPRARMDQSFNLPAFPASFLGERVRPRRLFVDPFSSPVPSWGNVPEADDAVPMAPLRQRRSLLPDDDGPYSEIREGKLAEIQRKYLISLFVGLGCSSEFERAPDGVINEMDIFEAYFEVGFRGFIHSLIAEVSACFSFTPSQLTPLSLLGKNTQILNFSRPQAGNRPLGPH
ncbi:hypothetical protein F2Q68_00007764 [Brassica cretica]|uniref:Uncharacterized protein n=1 Tax=Brassica cretica TaxID=69181 RepID=A0A8S9KPP1_BRACR|nr:hypothetical protein F2Q68_00007764 [Brassica cretica]